MRLRLLLDEELRLLLDEELRLLLLLPDEGLGLRPRLGTGGPTRVARVTTKGGGSKVSASSFSAGSDPTRIACCLMPGMFFILSMADCMVESCLQH